ncbi:MAG: hypothetical protein ACRECZ_02590 [Methylocella sp.]
MTLGRVDLEIAIGDRGIGGAELAGTVIPERKRSWNSLAGVNKQARL